MILIINFINSAVAFSTQIVAFSFSIFTLLTSALGIAAGELHHPQLYSVFGGLGFVALFAEVYAFSSVITMTVMQENREIISTLDNSALIYGLSATAVAGHGLAVISIFLAVRYAWRINFHFTRQDKLIYAEKVRQKKSQSSFFGVAELDDDYEHDIGGMKRGLRNIFDQKEREKRNSQKEREEAIREQEEEMRVRMERNENIF